jgi:HK97 family phage prohead protease
MPAPRQAPDGREYRYLTTPVELRADGDGPRRLVGHAAIFDTDTDIGPVDSWGWRERIAPGAFRTAIAEDDVRALFNHDPNIVLGRNRAGTLRMLEDAVGLAVDILVPDTVYGRDVLTLIERGDVSQMSFGFAIRTGGQMWEEMPDGVIRRTIKDVQLFDVSPVTFPAFPATDVAVREAREAGLLTRAPRDAERAREHRKMLQNRLALAELTL